MTNGQPVRRKGLLNFGREVQQTQCVGDRRPVFPHPLGHLLLSQTELVNETMVGLGGFDRVKILALKILNERQFDGVGVGGPLNHGRNFFQAGQLGRAPTPFAGDQLVQAAFRRSDEDGLQNPPLPHGGG